MALTRMGAWGLSMRRTTFTGTPAVVEPKPVQVTRGGGQFLDLRPRTVHIEPIKILLEDRLLVITRERIVSPPQQYVEPITILLWNDWRIITTEQFIDGATARQGVKIALKWLGWTQKDDIDPFGIL